jgi:hypothetical protein
LSSTDEAVSAEGEEGPMRSKVMLFCSLLWMTPAVMLSGCKGASSEDFSAALVEKLDEGSVAWNIHSDGTVRALLKARDDKPITANASGKITTGDGVVVELTQDAKSGVLEGKGLKLNSDLTQAKYDLVVEGKPWTGTLFVPIGGTADLAAGASASAKVKLPEAKIGPHGGTLQVVGGDVVELSANASTGELRAYLLDAQLKAMAAADREIKVGIVVDGKAELIALVPEPGGMYFTGKIAAAVDPAEITIGVKAKGQARADFALIGFQPGVALAVGATAPRVKIMVKGDVEAPGVDLNARAGLAGHGEVKGDVKGGANVKTGLDVKGPNLKVSGAAVANPGVEAKAGANTGAAANAGAGVNAGAGLSAGFGAGAGVNAGAKAGTETKAAATTDKKAQGGAKVQLKVP